MNRKILKIFLSILLIAAAGFTFSSSDYLSKKSSSDVIVSFVTYNAYGNNLYIDNLQVGKKPDFDLAVVAIKNIGFDTTYIADSSLTVYPQVLIYNAGKTNIPGTIYISLNSPELGYSKTDSIIELDAQYTAIIYFDSVTINAGTSFNFTAAAFANDSISSNDTLRQYGCYLKGAPKKILMEEFTSATSVACAGQNPYLDSFVYAHSDRIIPVKYHLGFPQPGIDSMYLADTTVNVRAKYYSIKSVPNAFYNGTHKLGLPYSIDSVLRASYNVVENYSSPISISAVDTLLAGDTIQCTITVNNLYNLSGRDLRLHVYALEKSIIYTNPPGTNGEKVFRDVFRRAYPDINGSPVSGLPGITQYIYKYHIDSLWQDTSIYTLTFIQNDNNHEVLNCAVGRTFNYISKNFNKKHIALKGKFIPDFASVNPIREYAERVFYGNRNAKKNPLVGINSYYELFEYNFPPDGWIIANNDKSATFEAVDGYNGPTLGGVRCMRMPFYEYSDIGAVDAITSVSIPGITEEDTLSFDYAYAQYLSNYADSLSVLVSTDNGSTFFTIFSAGGKDLATAQATTLSFAPTSGQWKTFSYPMSALLNPQTSYSGQPAQFQLQQNYPNPFNPTTTIYFKVLKPGFVTLKVYDITGRMVKELYSGYKTIGNYPIEFSSSGFASGVYFYRMTSGDNVDTKKMVIVK